ncbi:MAG: response regulator [Gammaproteobacteria bacterium]|nr:response regulator [Gammaproteobacteria bacterium]
MKKYSVLLAVFTLVLGVILASAFAWLFQHQLFMRAQQQQLEQYAHLVAIAAVGRGESNDANAELQALLEYAPIPVESIQLIDTSKKILLSIGNHSQVPAELTSDFSQNGAHWQLVIPATPNPASEQLVVMQGVWPEQAVMLPFLPWFILVLLIGIGCIVLLTRWQQVVAAAAHFADEDQSSPPLFLHIRKAFQKLQLQLAEHEQRHSQELAQLTQQQQLTEHDLLKARKERDASNEQYQQLQQTFYYWQQLSSRAQQMSEAELQFKVSAIRTFGELSSHHYQASPQAMTAPQWLLQSHSQWQSLMPAGIRLVYDEDPHAYQSQLQFDQYAVTLLLSLLLRQCASSLGFGDISVSYRLSDSPNRMLKVQIRYEGDNLPEAWRLDTQLPPELSWQQLDPKLLRELISVLGCHYQIESLEGLGTHIELRLPVAMQKLNAAKPFHSIGIYAGDECCYQIYKQSLLALGEQVMAANSMQELTKELKTRLVDLLVLILPDDFVVNDEQIALLREMDQRYTMLCFANPQLAGKLSSELQLKLLSRPMLLEQVVRSLAEQPEIRSQQLLVVDDNPTNLSFVRTILSGQGLSIDIAMTGAEAIKMATHSRYQLILMDIQLPDLPGTEVTKRIRQLRHHQQTMILAFTAHAMQDEMVSFKLAGMDDVLIKPLDAKKIAHILTRIRPESETLSPH